MRHLRLMRFRPALLAVLVLGGACVRSAVNPPTTPPRTLAQIVQSHDRETEPYYPFSASERGLRQYDRVLANDIGRDYLDGLQEICTRYRAELGRLDAAALPPKDRLIYDVFTYRLERCVESFAYPWPLLPVNQVGFSWPSRFPVLGSGRGVHPFKTVQNYEDFLGRVDGFVVWMDTAIANMRLGMARGITLPRDLVLRVLPQLDAQIVEDPRTSLFYEPIKSFPASIDPASRRMLEARYLRAIQEQIVPAYRRLRDFMQNDYLPRCRSSAGFADHPGGRAWYAWAVRSSTTTDLTPPQIYALGVAELARIRAEIQTLQAQINVVALDSARRAITRSTRAPTSAGVSPPRASVPEDQPVRCAGMDLPWRQTLDRP